MKRWLGLVIVAALAGVSLFAAYECLWNAGALMRGTPLTQPSLSTATLEPVGLLAVYCNACHSNGRAKIDLDPALASRVRRRDRGTWESVLEALRSEAMPPQGYPQPTAEERERLSAWVEERVIATSQDPSRFGRYLVRRLRRTEYIHAVRDLVGVHFQPPEDFPADDTEWNYSDGGTALDQAQRAPYLAAADKILQEAAAQRIHDMAAPTDDDDGADGSDTAASEWHHQAMVHQATGEAEGECARAILSGLALRAYRRPPRVEEVDALCDAFDDAAYDGSSFDDCLAAAVKLILTSPHFLYVVEERPDAAPRRAENTGDEFALASRLALFLWNSVPDEELLDQAERHVLRRQMPAQVRRMLKHPRAHDFAADFAENWLELGRLGDRYDVDAALVAAMRQETVRFVEHIVREDRSVLEFLDADYTFLNERLAGHYGIAGIHGEEMRRVATAGTFRGGLLTQASVLALTSPNGSTSPVQRGKWVLANLLDAAPPAPPVGLIEGFANARRNFRTGTMRQILEQHREHHSCVHCHAKLDAIGFALENFDAAGRWRTDDGQRPIDAAVVMPSGESLDGPVQLKAYLRGQHIHFVRGLSGKLLSYALGRGLGDSDRAALAPLAERLAAEGFRFSSLVVEVVRSEPFQLGWDVRER